MLDCGCRARCYQQGDNEQKQQKKKVPQQRWANNTLKHPIWIYRDFQIIEYETEPKR